MGEWRQVSKTPAACLEPSQCKTSGTAEAMVFFCNCIVIGGTGATGGIAQGSCWTHMRLW